MKLNTTSAIRWAIALCCATGTFLVTPISYARPHHSHVRSIREDRGEEKGKKDASKDKVTDSRDQSPDKGDR